MNGFMLFRAETILILVALGAMILDIFISDNEKRGKNLANAALLGVAAVFLVVVSQAGHAGSLFNGSFVQDGVAVFFKALFTLAAFFAIFMAREYQARLKRGHGEFILLILFSLIGMFFLVSAGDFLLFFVALEILSISLYIMTSYLKDQPASIEAGVKYLILGALSTAVFLYGLSFIYGSTGSMNYAVIQSKLALMPSLPLTFIFGMVLVVASLGFKIAAVPFHLWVPDVYQGAPTPVTAFLAIGSKAAGIAALLRLMLTVFSPALGQVTMLLAVLSGLTIVYGNLAAIPQTNIKRLLGYSSIGHAGYLLLGLAAFSSSGNEAVLFYLLAYLFSTAGAFLVLVVLFSAMKTDEISELSGLGQRSPILAAGMLISLLSLAGLPPLAGFFAKFYVLWSGVRADLMWLVILGLANVVTSLYYYLKVVKAIYLEKPKDSSPLVVSADQKAILYFVMISIVLIGVFQGPFVDLAKKAFLN